MDNKPLAGRKLRVSAEVNGRNCHASETETDATGRAYLRFPLPADLASTDGLLNVQLEHEGRQEAISRAIPIVLNRIDLQFFPEGGDFAAGLPSRVAFKALNEFGKPADVQGEVLELVLEERRNGTYEENATGQYQPSKPSLHLTPV